MNSICAEVEMNKLALLRPTLLLRYEYITIDKQDYNEIMTSKKNGWHEILKNNLSFLHNNGAIRGQLTKRKISYVKRLFVKLGCTLF